MIISSFSLAFSKHLFSDPECPQIDGGWGFAPDPVKELTMVPRSSAGFRGKPLEKKWGIRKKKGNMRREKESGKKRKEWRSLLQKGQRRERQTPLQTVTHRQTGCSIITLTELNAVNYE